MGGIWQGGACRKTATEAGGAHPTGMHSCSKEQLSCNIYVPNGILARSNSGKRLYLHRLTERNRKIRKLLKEIVHHYKICN